MFSLKKQKNIFEKYIENKKNIFFPNNDLIINEDDFDLKQRDNINIDKNENDVNKYKLHKIQKNIFRDDNEKNSQEYYNKINNKEKKKNIIESYPSIKNSDTLILKNNNIILFSKNIINNIHSFNYLNNHKKNNINSLKYVYKNINNICNNTTTLEKNEMRENSSLNSGNLNLLTTEVKTNDQFNSGSGYSKIFSSDKIKNTKKNRIENIKLTFNPSNIRFFNQINEPGFIKAIKQKNIMNNFNINIYHEKDSDLNLSLSSVENKNIIKNLDSDKKKNYKTYNKKKINNLFIIKRHSATFDIKKDNMNSKLQNSDNSLSVNEDDIDTFKQENSLLITEFDSKQLENGHHKTKSKNSKLYDYIQGPIEFEYDQENSSNKINQSCSKLKGIDIYEIQKKLTSIENDSVYYYNQMNEINNDLSISDIENTKNNIQYKKSYYSSINDKTISNNCSFKKVETYINEGKNISYKNKKYEIEVLINALYKIIIKNYYRIFTNHIKINYIILLLEKIIIKKSQKIFFKNICFYYINKEDIKDNIENKNQSFIIKRKNRTLNDDNNEESQNTNKDFFNNKLNTNYYFNKLLEKTTNINNYFNQRKINKDIYYYNNMNKNQRKFCKLNSKLSKLEQTEKTSDSKSVKINSFEENAEEIFDKNNDLIITENKS